MSFNMLVYWDQRLIIVTMRDSSTAETSCSLLSSQPECHLQTESSHLPVTTVLGVEASTASEMKEERNEGVRKREQKRERETR